MKHLLLTTIAAVLLVGCGESQQSVPTPETQPAEPVAEAATPEPPPEPPTAKAPDISIHEAAEDGNIEAVKQHLAAGADVNAKDGGGWTPLFYAAFSGRTEVAELLIAEGVDVNAKDNLGTLRYAASGGHKEIVELLIANGADVYAKGGGNGTTPLDMAIRLRRTETADLLRKHGGKTSEELKAAEPVAEAAKPKQPTAKAPDISIHGAAKAGDIETVKQHIAAGTDVNAKDVFGWTLLLQAVAGGHKEIVELLIDNGAEVNGKTDEGWIPLSLAACESHKEIVELLISEGAEVNAKERDGRTPLNFASKKSIKDLLRKHGGKMGAELKAEGK